MKFILFLFFVLFSGCALVDRSFVEKYDVSSFTLNVADWKTVKEEYRKATLNNSKDPSSNSIIVIYLEGLSPLGFCDPYNRIIWVMGDEEENPDAFVFGHEMWHLPELGGPFFHGNKPNIIPTLW